MPKKPPKTVTGRINKAVTGDGRKKIQKQIPKNLKKNFKL